MSVSRFFTVKKFQMKKATIFKKYKIDIELNFEGPFILLRLQCTKLLVSDKSK